MEKQSELDVSADVKRLARLPIIDPENPGKKYSDKEEKYWREIRTYEFMNLEEPGLMQQFSYGNSHNHHNFKLFHGGKYQLPRFIARHVESKSTPIWKWRPDGMGSLQKSLVGRKPRFQLRETYE